MVKIPGMEVPEEPELPYRLYWHGVEHHATALGYICMNYANLEGQVNELIQAVLQCSGNARRAIVDATGTRLETRCQLLLKLLSQNCPNTQFFDDVEALLNFATRDIAPLRNRLVHDEWIAGETPAQFDMRSTLKQTQSRAPKEIPPPTTPERTLESMWLLVRDIQEVTGLLNLRRIELMLWLQEGRLPGSPLLPARLRRRPAQAELAERATEEPALPPASSPE